MSSNFFQTNPSQLLTLKKWYQYGWLSKAEYLKFRKRALGMNVYKTPVTVPDHDCHAGPHDGCHICSNFGLER